MTSASSRLPAWGRLVALTALPIVSAFLTLQLLIVAWRSNLLAVDFQQEYLPAANAVLHGRSPYPALHMPLDVGRDYVYPPLVAFLSIPVAFGPVPALVATALAAVCVPLSLWLLGVRDWRCCAAAFLWVPVFNAIQTANVTLPLLLGCAVCWRFRNRPGVVSAAGGLTVAAKLLAWPLFLWLASTRRLRAAVGVLAVALAVTLALWAVLGFSGLVDFPGNLHRLQRADAHDTYSVSTLASEAGLSGGAQTLLWLALALTALAGVVAYGRRGDDARSFSCAMVAAIVASPIVWLHSFAFLLAPLALLRPRFTALWLLPAVMWFFTVGTGHPAPWQTALTLVVAGAVTAAALCASRPRWRGRKAGPGQEHPIAARIAHQIDQS